MFQLMKNKNTSVIALLILIGIALGICLVALRLSEMVNQPTLYDLAQTTPQRIANSAILDEDICGLNDVICPGEKVKTTAFSSDECHTTWCRNNPERIGHQVALNAKFGKVKKVYIPDFNKTYDVIGTTDENTEIDIYFGSDYQGAKEFGVKYLNVKFL